MKNPTPRIAGLALSLAMALALCHCASHSNRHATTGMTAPNRGQAEPPTVRRIAYLKGDDLKRVRNPEFVKTYHIGRTPGGNGLTMREAHRVYRLEKTTRWNLARGNPPLQPSGPVGRTVDVAFKPLPESKAIRAELNRHKSISEELDEARVKAVESLAKIQSRLAEAPASANVIGRLQEALAMERERHRQSTTAPDDPGMNANSGDTSSALQRWGERQASKNSAAKDEPNDDQESR